MRRPRLKDFRVRFHTVLAIVWLLALVIVLTLQHLHRQAILTLPPSIYSAINSLIVVVGTLFVASLLLRLTIRLFDRLIDQPEERIFYSKLYIWTIYSIGTFVILFHLGVSMGNITLVVGLIATGLAFAIRDVLLSFFGWIILLRKKPFRIGDYIRIGEDEGRVLHIGTFHVLVDGTHDLPEDYIRIPNRLFLEKSICILGKTVLNDQVRITLGGLPPGRGELIQALRADLLAALERKEYLNIHIDVRDYRLNLLVDYLTPIEQRQAVRDQVIGLVFKHFHEHIVFPPVAGG